MSPSENIRAQAFLLNSSLLVYIEIQYLKSPSQAFIKRESNQPLMLQ